MVIFIYIFGLKWLVHWNVIKTIDLEHHAVVSYSHFAKTSLNAFAKNIIKYM